MFVASPDEVKVNYNKFKLFSKHGYLPLLQLCTCRPPSCLKHTSQRRWRWQSYRPSAAPPVVKIRT